MYQDILLEKAPKALAPSETMSYFKGNSRYTRQDIIEGNMRLVFSVLSNYNVNFEDKKDLFQIGMIGLMKAVDNYKIEKETKFSSFAITCISNEIKMYFRKIKKDQGLISLDEPIADVKDSNNLTIADMLVDDTINVVENYEDKEIVNLLKQMVVSLNSKDSLILILYFGLFGTDALPQKDVAFRFNISRSYVSRLIQKNVEKLKELIANPPRKYSLRGKKPGSIFKLLKGYDKNLVMQVINELDEEDRILLYLRGGENLDRPIPSPFWNKDTSFKFNTKLLPKIKMLLEEKKWNLENEIREEEVTPMERYRREKLNEIHMLLLNMDMVNAQVTLHEYLADNNLLQYENFIVSLIILSVMDKDFTFTIPIRCLVLLYNGYQFNAEKYKEYFYDALVNDIAEAPLYLDIVKCLKKTGMTDISSEPLEEAYTRVLELKK